MGQPFITYEIPHKHAGDHTKIINHYHAFAISNYQYLFIIVHWPCQCSEVAEKYSDNITEVEKLGSLNIKLLKEQQERL